MRETKQLRGKCNCERCKYNLYRHDKFPCINCKYAGVGDGQLRKNPDYKEAYEYALRNGTSMIGTLFDPNPSKEKLMAMRIDQLEMELIELRKLVSNLQNQVLFEKRQHDLYYKKQAKNDWWIAQTFGGGGTTQRENI